MFEISQDALNLVHVEFMGRQVVEHDFSALSLQAVTAVRRFMGGCERWGSEASDDLRSPDRSTERSEAKATVVQVSDRRELLPVEVLLRPGCFALRGARSCATKPLKQTRFVDEDDRPTLSNRGFTESDHLLPLRARTDRLSRSRVWPVGSRTPHPGRASIRQIGEDASVTPNFREIGCIIRGDIHNSVGKATRSGSSLRGNASSGCIIDPCGSGHPKCGACGVTPLSRFLPDTIPMGHCLASHINSTCELGVAFPGGKRPRIASPTPIQSRIACERLRRASSVSIRRRRTETGEKGRYPFGYFLIA